MNAERISRRELFKRGLGYAKNVAYATAIVPGVADGVSIGRGFKNSHLAYQDRYDEEIIEVPVNENSSKTRKLLITIETDDPKRLADASRHKERAIHYFKLSGIFSLLMVPAILSYAHDKYMLQQQEQSEYDDTVKKRLENIKKNRR